MANTKKKGGLGAESYFENIPTLAPAKEQEPTPEANRGREAIEEGVADSDADIPEEEMDSEAAPLAEVEAEAAEEDAAVTYEKVREEETEPEHKPIPKTTEEAPAAEVGVLEPESVDLEGEDTEKPEGAAEPPQRQKIRRTYALYEETQIALEEMKLAARKQGVKTTLGDLMEDAVHLLMEKKGMTPEKTSY